MFSLVSRDCSNPINPTYVCPTERLWIQRECVPPDHSKLYDSRYWTQRIMWTNINMLRFLWCTMRRHACSFNFMTWWLDFTIRHQGICSILKLMLHLPLPRICFPICYVFRKLRNEACLEEKKEKCHHLSFVPSGMGLRLGNVSLLFERWGIWQAWWTTFYSFCQSVCSEVLL